MITSIHGSRCLLPFRSVHRHAALITVLKAVSYFRPSSISLILCRGHVGKHMSMACSVSDSECFFMAFNIFFKVKMLWHLWRYCTDVISSLPMSLMMSRTGITLDFCGLDSRGFQQSFPWVEALQCHLLNSGKCSSREPAVLDRCINLLNSSCF